MVKNWCIYIFLLVATVIFFLFYKMWVAWYCLMILLVFPLVALIMCIFSAVTFKYKVEAPGYVKLKEDASIIFRVNNLSSGFSFCKFNVTITDVMDGSSHNLGYTRHDKSQYDLPVDTTHCGSYIYNISKVKIYDMFGLFHINRVREKKFEVVVRPTPSMPKAMPNLNGFRAKSLRKSTSPHSEIYDIRDYALGDPIKTIHWKASAKKDRLLVKESQEECYGHSRVFMQLQEDRELLDTKLGEMLFTSTFFLNHDISHKIRILPPKKREVAFDIQSQRDLDKAIIRILHMKIPKEKANAG